VKERVFGCLKGLATGDAIGKQTETLSRDDVLRWYPDGIRGFEGLPGAVIPRYAANTKRRWRVGETTDDTEGSIAVARAILADGDVRHVTVGRELLKCTKCVHSGVRSLWEFHQAGNAARVTRDHNGCGAATRVAPVGILYASHRFDQIVIGARQASIATHGGPLGLAAAAATAAAVSSAIDGAAPDAIVEFAQRAAARAEAERSGSDQGTFAGAIRTIYADLRGWPDHDAPRVAERYFPRDPLTIVPLALALGATMPSVESGILLAANVGGDSDSVASIAGAILGARLPASVNEDWYRIVETVNDLQLMSLGEALAGVRY
jgi:ADP-ribosylglycohydrolase